MAKFTHALSVADNIKPEEKPICCPKDAGHHGTGVGTGQQAVADGEFMAEGSPSTALFLFPLRFPSSWSLPEQQLLTLKSKLLLTDSLYPAAETQSCLVFAPLTLAKLCLSA